MKKKLLAVAVSTLVAMPVVSLADVKIYGRAHVSLDMLDDGADYNELNVSSNSSRLGFKGESKQGNYTAFVQIEQQVDFNNGAANASARDTFVGLKGDFGSLRVGQFDTPFKAARGPANLFGDQLGDMRNLTRVGNGRFDERGANTIHFQTKDFSGLRFNLAYAVHEGDTHVADAKDEGVSTSVTYKNGGLDLALAYEMWGEDHSRGERDGVRLAAAYKLADNMKVVGFFQTTTHEVDPALEADVFGLGGEFGLSDSTALKAMYMVRQPDVDNADASMIAVGVEHKIDKQLRVYANYAMLDNDPGSNLQPWNQARTTGNAGVSNDETASGLSLGLRFDF